MKNTFKNSKKSEKKELFELFLLLNNADEVERFLNDLCTPQEIESMADRWKICKQLDKGELSYREINELTGASLATITRVARFIKDEPHKGYAMMLQRFKKNNNEK